MDQAERRCVRADNETGNDIAQDHGLFQTMKKDRYDAGDQHDYRQVLDKTDGMHGVKLLFYALKNPTPM